MDWHLTLGVSAGALQIAAIFPYLRDTIKGATRPNLVSWGIWTLEVLITLAAQLSAGASWSALLLVSATIINISVVGLCLFGYGYKNFGFIEWICLTLSLVALALWQITAIPLVAIGFGIAADAIAYIPTFVKTYRDPASETPVFWFLLGVVAVMSALSSTITDAPNLAFPVYYALINFCFFGLVFFGQKLKNRQV